MKYYKKVIKAAGEMFREEIQKGGDWYETRLELEGICKESGVKCEVKPFDQYHGPYALLKDGSKLWKVGEDSYYLESGQVLKKIMEKSGLPWASDKKGKNLNKKDMVQYLKDFNPYTGTQRLKLVKSKYMDRVKVLCGEIKTANFLPKQKELKYWTSKNTETTIQCDNLDKAKKIVEKSGVKQELEIKKV